MASKEQLLDEVHELQKTSSQEVHLASSEKNARKPLELESVLEGVQKHIATLKRLAEDPA